MAGFGTRIKNFFGIGKKKEKNAQDKGGTQQDVTKAQEEQQQKSDEERLRQITTSFENAVDLVAGMNKGSDRVRLEQMENMYQLHTSEANSLQADDKQRFDDVCVQLGEEIMKAHGRLDEAEIVEMKDEYRKISVEMRGLGMKRSEGGRHNKMDTAAARLDELDARRRELGKGDDAELNKLSQDARDKIQTASGRVEGRENAMVNDFMDKSKAEILKMGKAGDEQRLDMLEDLLKNMRGSKDYNKSEQNRTAEYWKLIREARGRIEADKAATSENEKQAKAAAERSQTVQNLKNLKEKFEKVQKPEDQEYLDASLGAWLILESRAMRLGNDMTDEIKNLLKETGVAKDAAVSRIKAEGERIRKQGKVDTHKAMILKQRSTPVETLIQTIMRLNGSVTGPAGANAQASGAAQSESILPTVEDSTMGSAEGIHGEAIAKSKGQIAREKIKEKATALKEMFTLEGLKGYLGEWASEWQDHVENTAGTLGDITGIVGDKGDYKEAQENAEKMTKQRIGQTEQFDKKEVDSTSIVGSVLSLLSGVLHAISLAKELCKWNKASMGSVDGGVQQDGGGVWKQVRTVMHGMVDLFGDLIGSVSIFTDLVPLLGSCLSLSQGGLSMMMDIMDMTTDSVHIEQARRDRARIFKTMQAKRAKYSGSQNKDQTAAEAYHVKSKLFQSKSADVNDKRKEMLEKVALANQEGAGKINVVRSRDMRSRNDSRYREAQYGIGDRMNALREKIAEDRAHPDDQAAKDRIKENKSKLRQMEALEMMEEYRETDKAHKKMVKALIFKLEDIIKGGVGLTSSGLKLTGEIAAMTGAGAPAAAVLFGTSAALSIGNGVYSLARTVGSKAYGGAREMIGTEDNKATTRTDMAISLIQRMEEIGKSAVWDSGRKGFKDNAGLTQVPGAVVIRQGRNVQQTHSILRRGLDADMPELIQSASKVDLRDKIAASFGQD